jgi:hypothetical protein
MESIQIILVIVIVSLTLLLVIVGIQVLFIIAGVKRILRKIESKVDATDMIDRKFVEEKVRGVTFFLKKLRSAFR